LTRLCGRHQRDQRADGCKDCEHGCVQHSFSAHGLGSRWRWEWPRRSRLELRCLLWFRNQIATRFGLGRAVLAYFDDRASRIAFLRLRFALEGDRLAWCRRAFRLIGAIGRCCNWGLNVLPMPGLILVKVAECVRSGLCVADMVWGLVDDMCDDRGHMFDVRCNRGENVFRVLQCIDVDAGDSHVGRRDVDACCFGHGHKRLLEWGQVLIEVPSVDSEALPDEQIHQQQLDGSHVRLGNVGAQAFVAAVVEGVQVADQVVWQAESLVIQNDCLGQFAQHVQRKAVGGKGAQFAVASDAFLRLRLAALLAFLALLGLTGRSLLLRGQLRVCAGCIRAKAIGAGLFCFAGARLFQDCLNVFAAIERFDAAIVFFEVLHWCRPAFCIDVLLDRAGHAGRRRHAIESAQVVILGNERFVAVPVAWVRFVSFITFQHRDALLVRDHDDSLVVRRLLLGEAIGVSAHVCIFGVGVNLRLVAGTLGALRAAAGIRHQLRILGVKNGYAEVQRIALRDMRGCLANGHRLIAAVLRRHDLAQGFVLQLRCWNACDQQRGRCGEALQQLADNIAEVGILQPILMRPVTPTADAPQIFEIVAGERRFRAAVVAGLLVAPASIKILTGKQAAEIQLLENIQRENPHPLEEAIGFEQLMLKHGYNADQLAAKVKQSRSYVYGRLKLCALSLKARELFLDDIQRLG